jgi:hypothetical protein
LGFLERVIKSLGPEKNSCFQLTWTIFRFSRRTLLDGVKYHIVIRSIWRERFGFSCVTKMFEIIYLEVQFSTVYVKKKVLSRAGTYLWYYAGEVMLWYVKQYLLILFTKWCIVNKCKGKRIAFPVQAYYRPVLQEFEAPRFLDNRHIRVVRLSAL